MRDSVAVKLFGLDNKHTDTEVLALQFEIDPERISASSTNNYFTIRGFQNEKDASKFVNTWNTCFRNSNKKMHLELDEARDERRKTRSSSVESSPSPIRRCEYFHNSYFHGCMNYAMVLCLNILQHQKKMINQRKAHLEQSAHMVKSVIPKDADINIRKVGASVKMG